MFCALGEAKGMNLTMKSEYNNKKNFIVLGSSFLILEIIIFFKVLLNMIYDLSSWEILSPIFNSNMKMAVMVFLIINTFLIFISALGTNIILNLVYYKIYGELKPSSRKFKIYLIYFIGYTLINLISVAYTVINKTPLDLLYINILSLTFFVILSILIYYIELNNYKVQKRHLKVTLLCTSILIFFCNGLITLFFVLNELL